jgi:sterol desaturase/sphingolipid hydroxylase (fatty acid hydroxylase superfamily)
MAMTISQTHPTNSTLRTLTFPLAVVMVLVGMDNTVQVVVPLPAMQALLLLTAVVMALACERLIPHSAAWRLQIGKDRKVDTLSFLSTLGVFYPALNVAAASLAASLAVAFSGAETGAVFPTIGPFALQVLVAAVIAEFGAYWLHRLAHQGGYLWRFHSVHHSAKRIYWLNSFRSHPVNIAWHFFSGVFILMLLGTPVNVLQGYAALAGVVSIFQHSNAHLHLGWLSYVFSTNEVHRWHHSTSLREGNNNYGNVVMIWDILFGTYYNPRHPRYNPRATAPQQVGLAGPTNLPTDSYWKLLAAPFLERFWKR